MGASSTEDRKMAESATRLSVKPEGKVDAPTRAPDDPFNRLRREVDRLFEDFSGGNWLRPFRSLNMRPSRPDWHVPAVDVAETDKDFRISADLPGFDAKDIEVSLRNGSMMLKGSKHEETEEKSADYYLKERQYGSFERSFAVPDHVDASKIEATFKNGVLTVVMPKTAEAVKPARQVAIKAG